MKEIQTTRIDTQLDTEVEVSTSEPEDDSGALTLRIVERGHMMEALLLREEVLQLVTALQNHVKRL